jgi:hypothetical protein
MTIHRPTTLPTPWAESLLRMLLKAEDRDSMSGDLLEEYRESIVPALGSGADRWYIRQVSWYVLRATWLWGALVGATLVIRFLFDALAPVTYTPGVLHPRSAIMSDILIATFALGACRYTWRSGHLRSGVLVALAAAAIGGLLSSAGSALIVGIWHDPQTLRAIQHSGGLDEALWGVPLLLLPIGLVSGTAGALLGKIFSWPVSRARRQA